MKNSSKILRTVALAVAAVIFIVVAIKEQADWQLFLLYQFYYTKYVYVVLIPISLIWCVCQKAGWFPDWFPYEEGFIRMCLINATLSIPICLLVEVESAHVYLITASAVYIVTYLLMSLIEFFSFFQAYYQYVDE